MLLIEVLCESVVHGREFAVGGRVGDSGERLGVVEGGLFGCCEKVGFPPGGECVNFGAGGPEVASGVVMEVEAVGTVVDLCDAEAEDPDSSASRSDS